MKSEQPGTGTSALEVTNISKQGFWLFIDQREVFLPFEHFPWFKDASVESILNVRRPTPDHLQWPDLDVDLTVDSLENLEKYPLISRSRP